MARKPNKPRVSFRKNRQNRARQNQWSRSYREGDDAANELAQRESIQAKGEFSRRRTVAATAKDAADPTDVASGARQSGRVLQVSGNVAIVEGSSGHPFPCAISRVLRTIEIEERSAIVAGDLVQFRLSEAAISGSEIGEPQGMIEVVEPRRGIITRGYRGREHVIAANVDLAVIVATPAEPRLKLNLVDRYLVAAGQGEVSAALCLNKIDLVDRAAIQPVMGLYAQLGYPVVATSARHGFGMERLRLMVQNRATVFVGQSGVGKSSLLNALQSSLDLRVAEVSHATLHGRHTTTTARLVAFDFGGWVVDTPGVRQFELWDLEPWEIEAHFVDFRPYIPHCRFPNCTHTHEASCAVKLGVECQEIDPGRYERYCNLLAGEVAADDG